MPNMDLKKNAPGEQPANERIANFDEVAFSYSLQQAKNEAERCLDCKNPKCVEGCPVSVDIPGFISKIKSGDAQGAYEIISKTNSLPAVCGRVCPQESQCEARCVRGKKGEPVAVGRLERYAADNAGTLVTEEKPKSKNARVAVAGSGPAGLTCAAELAKMGYKVTVFEAFHTYGGVLVYGIPEFRLPKKIVEKEIEKLAAMGVEFVKNCIVGKSVNIDELFAEGYKAVFIGTGAGLPGFLGIPGENAVGVFSANEYLTRINLMKAYTGQHGTPIKKYKKIIVVGGGNVAMDAARCARRMGAEVVLAYRRTEKEMPARAEELHHAKEEGVQIMVLTAPARVITDEKNKVTGLECVKMTLTEPDASGRGRPVVIENSNFIIETEAVISAVGTSPNPILSAATPDLPVNRKGCIITEENSSATQKEGVFAGGDIVSGAATVILAMGAGRKAAEEIDRYITSAEQI